MSSCLLRRAEEFMHRSLILIGSALVVLSACGGGSSGPAAPTISAQPRNAAVVEGNAVSFTVVAAGSGLTYQWTRDGADVAGATSATYSIASPTVADDGAEFRVVVSSEGGDVTSDPARLDVNPALDDSSANFVATWATAVQRPQSSQMPSFTLANSTLRQVVHLSIGGGRFRLNLSNLYGSGTVEIRSVRIARADGDWTAGDPSTSTIVAGTDHALTFGGVGSVSIPAGEEVTSDSVEFAEEVPPLQDMTITMVLGTVPVSPTGHPGARTNSYVVAGDHAADVTLTGASKTPRWFYISSLEVEAAETTFAVGVLGDSITDGKGSDPNEQNRWPDLLAQALADRHAAAPEAYPEVAVLNLGVGGNGFVNPWAPYMEAGVDRFDHDVLQQKGVKYAVVFMGVNDIAYNGATAADLEGGYADVVAQAQDAGVVIYGATITPFSGWSTANTTMDGYRTDLNDWLRTGAGADLVDGTLDFSSAVAATPGSDPEVLDDAYVSYPDQNNTGDVYTANDHLHFNAQGYAALVESIDLDLFL
jgi:lysophospholipase L1-like esterase